MGRIDTPKLTPEQRIELESGLRNVLSHYLRMHCHAILQKSEGRTSKEVGLIICMCQIIVNCVRQNVLSAIE